MRVKSQFLVFVCFATVACVVNASAGATEGDEAPLRNLARRSPRDEVYEMFSGLSKCQIRKQIDELMPQLQIAQLSLDPEGFERKAASTYRLIVASKQKGSSSRVRHLAQFPHETYTGHRFYGGNIMRECEFRTEIDDLMDTLSAARKLEDTNLFQTTSQRIHRQLVQMKNDFERTKGAPMPRVVKRNRISRKSS